MKIWEKSKTLAQARPMLKKRKCWSKCYKCSRGWEQTGTTHVSMAIIMVGLEQHTRFICDTCLSVIKSKKEDGGIS